MLPVPKLLTVTFCVALLPTLIVPKERVLGLALRLIGAVVAPFPFNEPLVGEFFALLVTEKPPLMSPVIVGANLICIKAVCPG